MTFNVVSTVPPRIEVRESLVGVTLGRPFVMKCNVYAYPKPFVYWQHEGNYN